MHSGNAKNRIVYGSPEMGKTWHLELKEGQCETEHQEPWGVGEGAREARPI